MADPERLLLVTGGQVNEGQFEQIRGVANGFRVERVERGGSLERLLPGAEILAGAVPEAAFPRAERLRWIHSWGAGVDRDLFPALVESDVVLTCSKGNGGIPLAEHVIALMLMLARNLPNVLRAQAEH